MRRVASDRKAFRADKRPLYSMVYVSMFLSNPFKPDPRVKREAGSLSRAGFRVKVLAWDREGRFEREEVVDGFEVVRFRFRSGYGSLTRLVPGFLLFYAYLLVHVTRSRPDVVHCHDMDTVLPGLIASLILGCKVVYDMHESYPDFVSTFSPSFFVSFLRILESFIAPRCDLVIVTSTMIGELARKNGARRIVAIMNCFDPFNVQEKEARDLRRRILGRRDDWFLVLYIGGLFPGRGLEKVVQAVSRVEKVVLFLGGYGPYETDLKRLVNKLGIEERVVFAGEVDPREVPLYDAAADLMFAMYEAVDPNNVVTIPNKLFESIAAAKPILVSDVGEKARLVSEIGNGIAVDPRDVDGIAQAIENLARDGELYARMVSRAKQGQDRYSWASMESRLIQAYRQLIACW